MFLKPHLPSATALLLFPFLASGHTEFLLIHLPLYCSLASASSTTPLKLLLLRLPRTFWLLNPLNTLLGFIWPFVAFGTTGFVVLKSSFPCLDHSPDSTQHFREFLHGLLALRIP